MANIRMLMICINCDSVFELNGVGRCQACGSTVVYPLARGLKPMEDRRQEAGVRSQEAEVEMANYCTNV